jgi:glycosyltransferase involved in cell wall biosynthesis
VLFRSVFKQKGPYQIIVVDGGSTDQTHNIVRTHSQIIWLTAPKGRASQMNVGANYMLTHQHTSNDWLLFLHADTLLPSNAFTQLYQLVLN